MQLIKKYWYVLAAIIIYMMMGKKKTTRRRMRRPSTRMNRMSALSYYGSQGGSRSYRSTTRRASSHDRRA